MKRNAPSLPCIMEVHESLLFRSAWATVAQEISSKLIREIASHFPKKKKKNLGGKFARMSPEAVWGAHGLSNVTAIQTTGPSWIISGYRGRKKEVMVLEWPSQSQDLDITEMLWRELQKHFANDSDRSCFLKNVLKTMQIPPGVCKLMSKSTYIRL